jgi:ribosomal protein S6--L-glutamate ligase
MADCLASPLPKLNNMNVLFITNNPDGNGNPKFIQAFRNQGDHVMVINHQEASYYIAQNNEHDHFYHDGERLSIRSFHLVVTRMGQDVEHGCELLQMIRDKYSWLSFTQEPSAILTARSKLQTSRVLRLAKVPIARTYYDAQPSKRINIIESKLNYPVIVKTAYGGSQGTDVHICPDREVLTARLEGYERTGDKVIVSEFIKTGQEKAADIRALVYTGKNGAYVAAAMERISEDGNWKTNISQGASGIEITLSTHEELICKEAAEAIGLKFAAIDIIRDEEGEAKVLEVNTNWGVKIADVVSIDIYKEFAKAAKNHAGKFNNLNLWTVQYLQRTGRMPKY